MERHLLWGIAACRYVCLSPADKNAKWKNGIQEGNFCVSLLNNKPTCERIYLLFYWYLDAFEIRHYSK